MGEPQVSLLADATRESWSAPGTPRPLRVTTWLPEATGPWPVVVLSHGTGGAIEDLAWLAEPLCAAEFLVAGVDHHGNSYQDEYLAQGFASPWERPRDLTVLLDHLIATQPVDKDRIGAAGFSLGGYTVAGLLGARLNPHVLAGILEGWIPSPPLPEFPDFIDVLRENNSAQQLAAMLADSGADVRDERVRAGFMMAPGVAPLVAAESLARVTAPVRIVWGDADDNSPPESNALLYLGGMANATGHSVGQTAGHYDFLGSNEDGEAMRAAVADRGGGVLRQHCWPLRASPTAVAFGGVARLVDLERVLARNRIDPHAIRARTRR